MTFVAVAPPSTVAIRSLPPLSGRLLSAYRAAWFLLAIGAVATLVWLVLSSGMGAGILLLRLAKGAVLIAVAAILFRRRRGDTVAALMSSALLLWTITSSFDVTSGQAPIGAEVADRLRFLLFTLALLLFPGGRWFPAWTRSVALASAAVFLLGVAETLGWLQSRLFLPLAIACVLAALAALLHRFRSETSEIERQQAKWIALGLVAGIALILSARGGAALNAAPEAMVVDPLIVEALFQLGVVVIAVGFLVSLLRYRLYDAEAVISRSAAFAVLTLALVATFAGSEALIEMLGQQYLGSGIGSISAAMAAAVAAVLLAPLHGRISTWAERHFQRDLADLKERLPELMAELSGTASAARIGQAALPRIGAALNADRLALVVDGSVIATVGIDGRSASRWADLWLPGDCPGAFGHDRASDFPLRMPLRCPFGSLRGWLLLGPRPDGSCFSRDDLEALQVIGAPLRTALFAAREREKEKRRDLLAQRADRKLLNDLRGRIAALEQATSRAG